MLHAQDGSLERIVQDKVAVYDRINVKPVAENQFV
jgi:hypothetical protein